MTPRERLQAVLRGEIPDRVPVAPDFSNMIPARMTGKPFWDLYLYQDPPIWEAYIACAKRFGIDSLMDGYFRLTFPEERDPNAPPWEPFIVFESDERIVTQDSCREGGRRVWAPRVAVYPRDNPPTYQVEPAKVGLPPVPARWRPVEGVKPVDRGPEGLKRVRRLLGDQGLVGVGVTSTVALRTPEDLYRYADHPEQHEAWAQEHLEKAEQRFHRIMALEERPDFLCVGGSGTLVMQTLDIVRRLTLPAVKRVIELASRAGIPTHVHSCGPEKALVRLFAEETDLTVIDPLETPPMGDCRLAELKRLHGDRIVLKGNLHTTDVMLRGTPDDVRRAAAAAMRDAGRGGRFILSTGDQCGRDTPDENLRAMVDAAQEWGVYDRETGDLPRLPAAERGTR